MKRTTLLSRGILAAAVFGSGLFAGVARADDWPMWGRTPYRNMISPEKNPPTDWDVKTGKNILWTASLGSLSNGNSVVSNGMVFIGTNNEGARDPNYTADAGVLMAFDANTGKFLWQRTSPKLPTGRVNDWPQEGMCANVYTEPGRLWYCTNRCEVVCLDLSPGAMPAPGQPPKEIWSFDMINKLGVFPHNMTSCSIAAFGDYIYAITANGVDDTHKHVVAPLAPAIVCFNKNTGKVVWTDNTPGVNVLHGQWSSPAIVDVNGHHEVIAPLGDAWVYAYEAETGKILWKFDMNPKSGVYPQTRNEVIATPCIVDQPNGKKYMYIANGQDPEHGEGFGHLYCVDITKEGDLSKELEVEDAPKPGAAGNGPVDIRGEARKGKPNPHTGIVWEYETFDLNHDGKIERSEHMNRTISTCLVSPAGLVYAPDFSGFVHCLDAKTGKVYWTYDMESSMWGSPMWADGKVYVTDEDGDIRIFADSKEMKKLSPEDDHLNLGANCYCSPVLVNGVLYLNDRNTLFAIKAGAQSGPVNQPAGEKAPKAAK
ncbi:MAG TPA: PQQ-binding-like beta-propeller repeat protein [Tepidisphaeraceae bacterium]|nr:PQQ-binding-like beta-propeller repeat protein [Tepidisphaeraceae bacterium]